MTRHATVVGIIITCWAAAVIGCGGDESTPHRPMMDSPTTLATGLQAPVAVAVDNDFVYVANAGDGSIVRLPKGKTEINTVTVSSQGLSGLAVDSQWAFFTNSSEGTVQRVRITGGTAELVAMGQDHPTRVVIASGGAYWINRGVDPGAGSVMTALPSGGTMLIASGQASPVGLAVDPSSVYWANALDGIWKAPLSGGTPQMLTSGFALGQVDINVVDGRLYVVGGMAAFGWIPLDGGEITHPQWPAGAPNAVFTKAVANNGQLYLLATGAAQQPMSGDAIWVASPYRSTQQLVPRVVALPTVTALAVDEQSIYWTEGGTGVNGALLQLSR
jgi:DNA-binding beta-propeller fold protein YncE